MSGPKGQTGGQAMTHKAAREALASMVNDTSHRFDYTLRHLMTDPELQTDILSALDKHLIPDGCVAVCSGCHEPFSRYKGWCRAYKGEEINCPLRGEKP